jgi:hypothetical protein
MFNKFLSRKKTDIDVKSLPGFWRFHLRIGKYTLFSSFYTRIDQACILWGLISGAIFITAQFLPINWTLQAVLWSILTIIGTVGMVKLTKYWVEREQLNWLLKIWVFLMIGGVIITDLSIFYGWGYILLNLCEIWLILNAIGYFFTAFAMRSRTFIVVGLIHFLSIFILPYVGMWQFLTTGIIMAVSVVLLAELQWDSINTCTANTFDYSKSDLNI